MPCDDECKSKQVKSFSHDPDPNAFVRVRLRLEVSGSAFISCHFHPKGQLISKCLFGIFNSPKKRTRKLDFTTMVPQVELFSFVFGDN